MRRFQGLAEVEAAVGESVGVSDWHEITQGEIDTFADATHDHYWIHTDPEKAASGPFGSTIAHGFLTLSLLSAMNFDCLPRIVEQTMGINYGFDKVRFMTPVKSGARVRGRFVLAEARFRGAGMVTIRYDVTVDIENERKPALTADWITIIQFDPRDRPETV